MSYTNTTQYVTTWDDINTAFGIIDTALHNIAVSAGITEQQAQALIDTSLVNAIFYDATNGTGITSNQYSKLKIQS